MPPGNTASNALLFGMIAMQNWPQLEGPPCRQRERSGPIRERHTTFFLATKRYRQFKNTDNTAIEAEADERKEFARFVREIDEPRLLEQQRLPYRRVFSTAEHDKLDRAVTEKWGKWYGGYPDKKTPHSEVATLHVAAMEPPESYAQLRRILREHGVAHVLELRKYGDRCEIPIDSASFVYDGAEGFWTSDGLDWLVYASHESSITFGSHWLVEAMRSALPEFERYTYKGWDRALCV